MKATSQTYSMLQEHICEHCGSEFESKSATAKFCSAKCKQANYNRRKAQTVAIQQQEIIERVDQLNELQRGPITHTETVRISHPDWLQAQQAYEVQQQHCNHLKVEMTKLRDDERDLQSNTGAYIGIAAGVGSVLMLMAHRHDNRKQQPLGMFFAVMSLVLLVTIGIVGYWIGQSIHQSFVSDDEQKTEQLATLRKQRDVLSTRIKAETIKSEQLHRSLGTVPKFLSVTETRTDEVTSLTSSR